MAKTGHPNFAIKVTSQWRGTEHVWSLVSSHSGATLTPESAAFAFVQAVWNSVIAHFIAAPQVALTYVSGWDYYDGTDSASLYSAEYASSAASVTAGWLQSEYGDAYTSAVGVSGLECCVVLEAPVGLSKTGKPVTLKKFIHAVPGGISTAPDTPPYGGSGADALALKLGDGSLPGSRVLISASGKQGTWAPALYFGNHQMPRRRRKASSGGASLVELAAIAKALEAAGEAALAGL